MKHQITLTNEATEYAYGVVTNMLAPDRATLRNVNALYKIFKPLVDEFSKQFEAKKKIVAEKLKALKQIETEYNKRCEAKPDAEGIYIPFASEEEKQKAKEDLDSLKADIEEDMDAGNKIKKTKVNIIFNSEEFNSFNSGIDAVMSRQND